MWSRRISFIVGFISLLLAVAVIAQVRIPLIFGPPPVVSCIPPSGPWFTQDIGTGQLTGSACVASTQYTVSGSGMMYFNSDQLRIVSQNVVGNYEITARVVSHSTTGPYGEACGVVVRDSLSATAANAAMYVSETNSGIFQWRAVDAGVTDSVEELPTVTHVRLRLIGAVAFAYYSTDGINYIQSGASQAIGISGTWEIGIFAASAFTDQLATCVFNDISVVSLSSTQYGPTASIVCPFGSVNISAGTSIQTAINTYPNNTSFCLGVGVHSITANIVPKTGNTFTGTFGAIIDGATWSTGDPNDAAFKGYNSSITGVTIRNLVIRDMPQQGINVFGATTSAWVMEYNEIWDCAYKGINLGKGDIARNNKIRNNPNGNYSAFEGHGALFENNEISYGGNEQKIVRAANVVFRGNWVHHNTGNGGIWYDAAYAGMLVENNIIEDNDGAGIFIEQSPTDVGTGTPSTNPIRNNVVNRNAVQGILISISHSIEIYGNTLSENARGISYFIDCIRIDGTIDDLMHVNSHDNTITVADAADKYASELGYLADDLVGDPGGCTVAAAAPYVNMTKDLVFQNNDYYVPDTGANEWVWGNSFRSWAQWQALPQDSTGSVNLDDVEDFGGYRPHFQGYGADTLGGRTGGNRIHRITSLSSGGGTWGDGTLRGALEGLPAGCTAFTGSQAACARFAIPEVSGWVNLSGGQITVTGPYLTFAGQTAPSNGQGTCTANCSSPGGMGIYQGRLLVDTHNVVLQHLRIRYKDGANVMSVGDAGDEGDNSHVHHVALDHLSVSWVGLNVNNLLMANPGSHDFYIGDSIFSECRWEPGPDGGINANVGQDTIATRNLFAQCWGRNPIWGPPVGIATNHVIVVNNLVYNAHAPGPGDALSGIFLDSDGDGEAGGLGEAVIMNNQVIAGPDSGSPTTFMSFSKKITSINAGSKAYLEGNIAPGVTSSTGNGQWNGVRVGDYGLTYTNQATAVNMRTNVLFSWFTAYAIQQIVAVGNAVRDAVLANVGARPTDRDGTDTRVIADVTQLDGTHFLNWANIQSLYGGLQTLTSRSWTVTLPASPNTVEANGRTAIENSLEYNATHGSRRLEVSWGPP